jgi:hypothetical protein
MLHQYFGQYLLNKGIIKPEQLYDALEAEQAVRVKIGVLAINAGYMTAGQVEEVHARQYTQDRRFGEIALEKGYLTGAQLDELLRDQEKRSLTLSQAILDKGYLTLEQLEKALVNYREDAELSLEQVKVLQGTDFGAVVRLLLDFSSAGSAAELYYNYTALTMRNIVRFLNALPVLGAYVPDEVDQHKWVVSQVLTGDITLYTGLVMNDHVLLELARCYSNEDLNDLNELTLDSAAEFLNVNNGLFCVNLSENGLDVDMLPQETQQGFPAQTGGLVRVGIRTPFGEFTLLLGVQ